MSRTARSPLLRGGRLWRAVAAVSALTLTASVGALLAPTVASASTGYGGFAIDGVPPAGGFPDLVGNLDELGVRNTNNPKLAQLQDASLPLLDATNPNGSADLSRAWISTSVDADDQVWLYFAWQREDNTGSSSTMFELQRAARPATCDPALGDAALVTACNPWQGRTAGDQVIVWDQQGNTLSVGTRTWLDKPGGGLTLGPLVPLVAGSPVLAATFSAARSFGEAAVNLSATVFAAATPGCVSYANVIPMTVVGNSDSADVKDMIFADTSAVEISNCGSIEVTKTTDPTTATGEFTVTASRPGPPALPVDFGTTMSRSAVLTGNGQTQEITDLRPAADYAVTETIVGAAGWRNVSITCDNVAGGRVVVRPSTTTTCAVVNRLDAPAISVEKEASPASGLLVGQTVSWTADVTSTGNVPLSSVQVADPQCAGGAMGYRSGDDGDAVLEDGETWRYDCTTTVTQADVDAGGRDNTATASGAYGTLPRVEDADGARFETDSRSSVAVDKAVVGAAAGLAAGDVVTYEVTVRNSGTRTLSDVQAADPLCTLVRKPGDPDTGAAGTLDPGETWTYTCTYTVTQADVDAGGKDNRAVGSAQPPTGARVEDDGTARFTTDSTASFTSVKRALDPTVVPAVPAVDRELGDPVLYVVEVTNSGSTTLGGASVTDPGCAPLAHDAASDTGAPGTLSPGETWRWTCTYTTTQADVDRGSRDNTATAQAERLDGTALAPQHPTATFTTTGEPDLRLTKVPSIAGAPVTTAGLGADVLYTVTATNTGTLTLTDVVAGDPLCTLLPAGPAVLAPGESTSWTCTVRITQTHVDAGKLDNTATASARAGATPLERTASATVLLPRTSVLDVEKTGPAGPLAEGAPVPWTVTVRNAGGTTLTALGVTDSLCTLVQEPGDTTGPTVLAVGEVQTYTCTTTVSAADVLAGSVLNTAAATAVGPDKDVDDNDSAVVLTLPDVRIVVDKTAVPASGVAAGDPVRYEVTATNGGNVPLSGVTATDPRCDLGLPTGDTDGDGLLDLSETWTWGCTYRVTQADVDGGPTFSNTATGSGSFSGTTDTDTGTAVVASRREAAIVVEKLADPPVDVVVGSEVVYELTVTNPGTVSLSAVTVTDPLCTPQPTGGDADGDGRLQPTETWTWTCTYTVTQDDVDRGRIDNTATAVGTGHDGPVQDTDDADVLVPRDPRLRVVKTASPAAGVAVGDTVTYAVTVENTGNTTLRDVVVTDPLCALQRTVGDDALQVGEVWTWTCAYVVVQADVDRGRIDNTATATATGGGRTVTGTASAAVTAPQSPALAVDKTATPSAGAAAGDEVVWTVTARNSGDVTLTGVVVTDPLCALVRTTGDDALSPGETWTYRCTYTVTAADVERGSVVNTATGSGTGGGRTVTDTGTATVTVPQLPAIAVDKTATPASGVLLGEEVLFTVTARSTGNVPLSAVVLTDPLCALAAVTGDADADDVLDLGETWTATCRYAVTQADVDRGSIANTATGRGSFGGTTVTGTGTATVAVPRGPALAVAKAASPLVFSNVGDVIRYTYVVTNTGTTTLAGPFSVEDDKTPVTCPATASLARGASLTCTADYAITAADLAAGSVVNVARATNGTVVSPEVSARVDEVQVLPTALPSPSASPTASPSASPTASPTASGSPSVAATAASAPVRPATLPFTGVPVLPVLALGSGGVLVGALLVGAARARREED